MALFFYEKGTTVYCPPYTGVSEVRAAQQRIRSSINEANFSESRRHSHANSRVLRLPQIGFAEPIDKLQASELLI
jgi:hypothetical protein